MMKFLVEYTDRLPEEGVYINWKQAAEIVAAEFSGCLAHVSVVRHSTYESFMSFMGWDDNKFTQESLVDAIFAPQKVSVMGKGNMVATGIIELRTRDRRGLPTSQLVLVKITCSVAPHGSLRTTTELFANAA
ncbi:MAG: hypothetical protein Q7S66_02400 [bacterium]|nr:hypothetical protein [bacterium]